MQPGTFLFSPCRCRSRSILFCTLYPVRHNGIIQEDYFVEQTMVFSQFKKQFNISLNEQQEAAVQATEGPVMLLAVPGSAGEHPDHDLYRSRRRGHETALCCPGCFKAPNKDET